jgi:hypothetical protein
MSDFTSAGVATATFTGRVEILLRLVDIKAALGLPLTDDPEIDPKLLAAIRNSQLLVEGYLQGPIVPTQFVYDFVYTEMGHYGPKFFLPHHPLMSVDSVVVNGVLLTDGYRSSLHRGYVQLDNAFQDDEMVIGYTAGFNPAAFPADLKMVLLNLAVATYNMGGDFTQVSSGGTGELKSLTMFDAMSMSFDVGGASSSSDSVNTPYGLVSQWAYVLDKYRFYDPTFS